MCPVVSRSGALTLIKTHISIMSLIVPAHFSNVLLILFVAVYLLYNKKFHKIIAKCDNN